MYTSASNLQPTGTVGHADPCTSPEVQLQNAAMKAAHIEGKLPTEYLKCFSLRFPTSPPVTDPSYCAVPPVSQHALWHDERCCKDSRSAHTQQMNKSNSEVTFVCCCQLVLGTHSGFSLFFFNNWTRMQLLILDEDNNTLHMQQMKLI